MSATEVSFWDLAGGLAVFLWILGIGDEHFSIGLAIPIVYTLVLLTGAGLFYAVAYVVDWLSCRHCVSETGSEAERLEGSDVYADPRGRRP